MSSPMAKMDGSDRLRAQSLGSRVIQANQRGLRLASASIVFAIVVSMVTSVVVIYTRPTHVEFPHAGSGP